MTGANVEGAEASDDGVELTFGGETEEFDYLVIAAGRGARRRGPRARRGRHRARRARADQGGRARCAPRARACTRSATSSPGPALAHKASDEGIIAVEDAAGMDDAPDRLRRTSRRATFCYPQVASFGLTEAAGARRPGTTWWSARSRWAPWARRTVYGDRGGMIKIVGDKKYGELLGAHIVSVKAADLIQELVIARELEGGYPEVARIIHAHPSFAEAVMEAARATDGWLIHG